MFYVHYDRITKEKGMLQKFQRDNFPETIFPPHLASRELILSIACLLLRQELQTTIQYKIQ